MSVTADNSKTINRKPSEAWMFLDTVISLLPDCLQRKNTNIFIQENTSKMEVPFPLLLRFVFWVLVKSVLNIPWKDWCWSWNSNTLATWWELTHWKRPWCWERLKSGGEGHDKGWHGWMASLTLWTWVSASARSWWWRGRLAMLQSMVLQRVRHDWVTELNPDLELAISPGAFIPRIGNGM